MLSVRQHTVPDCGIIQEVLERFIRQGTLLKKKFNAGGELQCLLLRFIQALISQMAQMAISARFHTIEQQLS